MEMADSHELTCVNMQLRENIFNSLASFTRNIKCIFLPVIIWKTQMLIGLRPSLN